MSQTDSASVGSIVWVIFLTVVLLYGDPSFMDLVKDYLILQTNPAHCEIPYQEKITLL